MLRLILLSVMFFAIPCAANSTSGSSDELTCFDKDFAQLYRSGWHLLEDIFITQPQAKIDRSLSKKMMMGGIAASTGLASFLLSKKALDILNAPSGVDDRPYPYLERKRRHIQFGSGIATGLWTYTSLRTHLLAIEERKQLACLMENWEGVKEFLPNTIAAGLNKLAEQYRQKGPHYTQNCDEALRLIKNAVCAHFPQTYSNKKLYDALKKYVYIYLNIDLIELAGKAFTLGKNLIM